MKMRIPLSQRSYNGHLEVKAMEEELALAYEFLNLLSQEVLDLGEDFTYHKLLEMKDKREMEFE